MERPTYRKRMVQLSTVVAIAAMTMGLCSCSTAGDMTPAVAAKPSMESGGSSGANASGRTSTAASSAPQKSSTNAEAPKPRTKAVPAPSSGNIREKVKRRQKGSIRRVDLGREAALPEGVHVKVEKVTPFITKAETPGEIAGPALGLKVLLTNSSKNAINVDSAMVSITQSNGDPAQPTTSDPYSPFSGEIAPGSHQTATYVFLIPKKHRKNLTVSVEYLAGKSIADFNGNAS
ncbi:hypothetical protein CIK75_04475 [Glutamicibacter sp. BW78]|nr:hypothetical protein CIK75_04475 [Glutamicibacter sp. BW78]